jgi:hypothetical protein
MVLSEATDCGSHQWMVEHTTSLQGTSRQSDDVGSIGSAFQARGRDVAKHHFIQQANNIMQILVQKSG